MHYLDNHYLGIDVRSLEPMNSLLLSEELEKLRYVDADGVMYNMFEVHDSHIKIPRGYLNFFSFMSYVGSDYEDRRTNSIPSYDLSSDSSREVVSKILGNGITLRVDQVDAIVSMILNKVGIVQMSTGSGKTYVLAGYLKVLNELLGRYPNTVILVPTNNLVNQLIDELSGVGIPITKYGSSREIGGVQVTHPASLNNDFKSNDNHMDDLEVLLCDEGHHLVADSWNELIHRSPNLECKLAVSASILSQAMLDDDPSDLTLYSWDEYLITGYLGRLLVNYQTNYYLREGVLAVPILFQLVNASGADKIKKLRGGRVDFHDLRARYISEPVRVRTAIEITKMFAHHGRRVLFLVNNYNQLDLIMKGLYDDGLGDVSISSSGGGYQGEWVPSEVSDDNPLGGSLVHVDDSKLEDYRVIVGTSVMYEGVDLPQLDTVVLFDIGKVDRVVIQTVGRALRKSKTGKYAYVVDFTDHENPILNKHSEYRLSMYNGPIGIPVTNQYLNIFVKDAYKIFLDREGL